jgi:hypothetical protein
MKAAENGCMKIEYMKKQVIISITGLLFDVAEEREWDSVLTEDGRLGRPHYFVGREGEVWLCKPIAEPTTCLGVYDDERVHVALCNVGPLVRRGERFYAKSGEEVRYFYEFCTQSPYRGHVYYELLTPKQLDGLERLLRELIRTMGINYRYDASLGSLSVRCMGGGEGVYLASGLVKGRIDPHPQMELIKMMRKIVVQPRTAAEN